MASSPCPSPPLIQRITHLSRPQFDYLQTFRPPSFDPDPPLHQLPHDRSYAEDLKSYASSPSACLFGPVSARLPSMSWFRSASPRYHISLGRLFHPQTPRHTQTPPPILQPFPWLYLPKVLFHSIRPLWYHYLSKGEIFHSTQPYTYPDHYNPWYRHIFCHMVPPCH